MVDSLAGLIRRGPYDQITIDDTRRIEAWGKDKEAQALFQKQFREFIETKPLYSSFKLTLPPGRTQFYLEVARLYCTTCKPNSRSDNHKPLNGITFSIRSFVIAKNKL